MNFSDDDEREKKEAEMDHWVEIAAEIVVGIFAFVFYACSVYLYWRVMGVK